MSKKIMLIPFLLSVFMAVFFVGLASAGDVSLELTMTDQSNTNTRE